MSNKKLNDFKNATDKQLKFRGELIKAVMPNACKSWMKFANAMLAVFYKGKKMGKGFNYSQTYICTEHNKKLRLCIYKRKNSTAKNKPLVFWIHGGGYGIGVPEQEVSFFKDFLSVSDCVIVSPDYIRSVESPYPSALLDCYDALLWAKENAKELEINPSQIFIGGESAGGGLCLALALYARDKKQVNIAFQMPIYPMIDNRPTKTNQNNSAPVWNSKSNDNAWRIYLGELYGSDSIPYYAVPATAPDFSNLPTTLTYVGDIEPFTAETQELVKRLESAGIKTFFKLCKGCYHGFDVVCPNAQISKDARSFLREGFEYAVNNCFAKQNN